MDCDVRAASKNKIGFHGGHMSGLSMQLEYPPAWLNLATESGVQTYRLHSVCGVRIYLFEENVP